MPLLAKYPQYHEAKVLNITSCV